MAYKVCLDAGHYGKYNRSPVYTAYYESDMTWKLHNYLADELQKYNITVVKTRASQDVDRELVSRGYASKGCDLFISLHSNASSNANTNYAIAICQASKSGVSYDDKSRAFGAKLAATVGKVMGCEGRTGTRAADWDRDGNGKYDDEYYGVLQGAKNAGTPGVIMEHGFHTNLAQTKWLYQDANLKKLAVAEAETIAEYLGAKKTASGSSTGSDTGSGSGSGSTNTSFPSVPFTVKVLVSNLNMRSTASSSSRSNGYTGKGEFTITKMSGSWGYLKSGAGWIYLGNAEWVTIGKHVEIVAEPKSFASSLRGSYKVTASALNLRMAPGTGTIMIAMPKGTVVNNYGYYTQNGGVKWLYVQTTVNKKSYTGYCSLYYLQKQ